MRSRYDRTAIQRERLKRQWTVKQLARKARISWRNLYKIERDTVPKANTLCKIASAFGLPVTAFTISRRV